MGSFDGFRIIVVGSGFFGSVVAHCVATQLGLPVLVLEKRPHIGGNAHSEVDAETGIEYHRYGSHIFHTSNPHVWEFVRQFSDFNNYRHRVFARQGGRMYTIPINLMTINNFFGASFSPAEARAFIEAEIGRDHVSPPDNLEDKAISLIGRRLYDAFIRGYTMKQWETDPRELPPEIIARLPVRFTYDDFYFSDTFEGLPLGGYYRIFERMLSVPNIQVELNCDFFQVRAELPPDALVVYTGPIDRYYDYRCGVLGWRTMDFEIERPHQSDYQGAAIVNYPGLEHRFTRIHEFRHLHPERPHRSDRTLIMREYARFAREDDEPYYPIGTREDKQRYLEYRALALAETQMIVGGRLGTYRYLDMHQAIGAALKCFSNRVAPWLMQEAPLTGEDDPIA